MNRVRNQGHRWLIKLESWLEISHFRFLFLPVQNWIGSLSYQFRDWSEGINTVGDVSYSELGFTTETGFLYEPGGWRDLKDTLGNEVSPEDVFIDFGSGKGRMVYLAVRDYPFKRVIGVEINEKLNQIARQNILKRLANLRCRQVELVTSNVLQFEIPDDITVIYLFNPFGGNVFTSLLDQIQLSLERRPRQIRLIYRNPVMHYFLMQYHFHLAFKMEDLNLYTID